MCHHKSSLRAAVCEDCLTPSVQNPTAMSTVHSDYLLGLLPPRGRAALFVDLPPAVTLPSARALAERGLRVVPVVQRWAGAGAVLSCGHLVELLVACQPRHGKRGGTVGAVFLLDGDRAGPPGISVQGSAIEQFDNRYEYPVCRFPTARFLQDDGVTVVRWLGGGPVADDVRGYVRSLAEAGLIVEEVPAPSPLV
jgi:hypothetical protein